jgi:hypothetical protein
MHKPLKRQEILDFDFVEARHKLIDIGAFLDRVARSEGDDDFRMEAFRSALREACKQEHHALHRTHAHMVSRTTDDYISMAPPAAPPSANPHSGPASTARRPTASTTTSCSSPNTNRSAPPSSACRISAGSASTRRNRRTPVWQRKCSPDPRIHRSARTCSASARSGSTRTAATNWKCSKCTSTRRPPRPAHPRPHPAPRGQAQGHPPHARCAEKQPGQSRRNGHHRPRRGTHRRHGAGRRLLGRHDALSGISKCSPVRAIDIVEIVRRRAPLDEQRLRLGRQHSALDSIHRHGNAPARPQCRRRWTR